MNPETITPEVVAAHNLTSEEFERIRELLGREPTYVELGVFSVMWSEHCSYKSSRTHLKRLPTQGERVIVPPGENAGIVDVGDGWCAAFKVESHNHPSFIEPFQGAATGVGGILRDIFTMGARPVAAMNSLRFGTLTHPEHGRRNRALLAGVVAGIAHYGNAFGVPTVGGEVVFDDAYGFNPLVNAFALGLVRHDQIFFGKAAGIGNPVLYVGAKTGRDGIHGATMASAEFDEEALEKRPTVQVGDPFLEKLLLEACLEAMRAGAVAGIQDMGAAGLTSSSCEMAARAGNGIELDLSLVPQREEGMTAYEIMLSESQERMLIVAHRGRERQVIDIFSKWDLDAVVIGRVTDTGSVVCHPRRAEARRHPLEVSDRRSAALRTPDARAAARQSAIRFRATTTTQRVRRQLRRARRSPRSAEHGRLRTRRATTRKRSVNCSRRRTSRRRSGSTGSTTTWCGRTRPCCRARTRPSCASRRRAARSPCGSTATAATAPSTRARARGSIVAESARNVVCVGARPLAITNCLNFACARARRGDVGFLRGHRRHGRGLRSA